MKAVKMWMTAAVLGAITGIGPAPSIQLHLGSSGHPMGAMTRLVSPQAEARETPADLFQIKRAVQHMDDYMRRLDRLASDTDSVRCSYRKTRDRFDTEKRVLLDEIKKARLYPRSGYTNRPDLNRSLASLRSTYARVLVCYE